MKSEESVHPAIAICHFTAPPIIGGVEAVIQSHCTVFSQNNVPVTILAGRGAQQALPAGTDFICIPEMDSRHSRVQSMNARLEEGIVPDDFESFVENIREKLGSQLSEFDHVIVHNVFTKHFNLALTAALFQLIEDGTIRHCIAWCHDFSWTSENSRRVLHSGYPWDLLRKYLPEISYVTISDERKRSLVKLLGCDDENVQVIYNGVDAVELLGISSEGYDLIERLGLLDSELNLIMPVRVTHAKNIELALNLAAAIKQRGISFRLILTGPPDPHDEKVMDYFHDLQEMRDELDLQEEMHFIFESGPEPGEPFEIGFDRVCELMRASDLMLMPSHREGFGMPVLEAGMLGLEIFTTAVPAAKEIAGENVHIFQPNSAPEDLADNILAVMQKKQAYQFRQQVRRHYRWKAVYRSKIKPLLGIH